MSINRVVLVGRLTRNPEARTTTNGKSVASFGIAVNRKGPRTENDADFFTVTCWNQTAEYVTNYLTKGRLVAVDGRLSQRKYTTSDGQSREVIEVVADNVQGLDRAPDGEGRPAANLRVVGADGCDVIAGPHTSGDWDPFAEDV